LGVEKNEPETSNDRGLYGPGGAVGKRDCPKKMRGKSGKYLVKPRETVGGVFERGAKTSRSLVPSIETNTGF